MSKRLYGTIRRLPSGRWQDRYRHPSTGLMVPAPITFDRKGDAARWLSSAETDQNRGVLIEPSQAKTTVAEWAALWLDGDPASAAAPGLGMTSRCGCTSSLPSVRGACRR